MKLRSTILKSHIATSAKLKKIVEEVVAVKQHLMRTMKIYKVLQIAHAKPEKLPSSVLLSTPDSKTKKGKIGNFSSHPKISRATQANQNFLLVFDI